MRDFIVRAQPCPVCSATIECHTEPKRWVHKYGPCTSADYERMCNPHPELDSYLHDLLDQSG